MSRDIPVFAKSACGRGDTGRRKLKREDIARTGELLQRVKKEYRMRGALSSILKRVPSTENGELNGGENGCLEREKRKAPEDRP